MSKTVNDTLEFPALPTSGRILGIDYGTVRIGLAISDPDQTFASPLIVYTRRTEKLDLEFFASLIKAERVVGCVVGLPIHLSGDPSPKSKEAQVFGNWLSENIRIPITWVDERFTTAFARDILNQSPLSGKKRKAQVDKLAAQIVLTAYLESCHNNVK